MELQRIEGLAGRIAKKVCAEKLNPAYVGLNKAAVDLDKLMIHVRVMSRDNKDQKDLVREMDKVSSLLGKAFDMIADLEDKMTR